MLNIKLVSETEHEILILNKSGLSPSEIEQRLNKVCMNPVGCFALDNNQVKIQHTAEGSTVKLALGIG